MILDYSQIYSEKRLGFKWNIKQLNLSDMMTITKRKSSGRGRGFPVSGCDTTPNQSSNSFSCLLFWNNIQRAQLSSPTHTALPPREKDTLEGEH